MSVKKYTSRQARMDIPQRLKKDNKTQGGKTLVVAGSSGMWGAGILCATAASRVGAGYVYLYGNSKTFPLIKNPDFLWTKKTIDFSRFQAIALGPGYTNKKNLKKIIQKLIQIQHPAVVLDAEALNLVNQIKKIPSSWILTPHEGELGRMLQVSSAKIRLDRKKYAQVAQKKYGCVVVLKGYHTCVMSPHQSWQIQSGNPALSKAGTGDVLTGLIAGLLSQKLTPIKAACLGSFIHGYMSDKWIKEGNDVLSLMASDLVKRLPQALTQIRKP